MNGDLTAFHCGHHGDFYYKAQCPICERLCPRADDVFHTGTTDGGHAFPSPTGNPIQHGQLSVRDYFAAAALSGWYKDTGSLPPESQLLNRARHFYVMADAMLKARVR